MWYIVIFLIGLFFGFVSSTITLSNGLTNKEEEAFKTGYTLGVEDGKKMLKDN